VNQSAKQRIKILFFGNEIDYSGTWRSHERIIQSLDKLTFEPYVFYWDECPENYRLEQVKKLIGRDKVIPYQRSKEKAGREQSFSPEYSNFIEKALAMNFDIIHFARTGYPEWPLVERIAPLQIETNIFGKKDDSPFLDKTICICRYVAKIRQQYDRIIYNPIPEAEMTGDNFRNEFNIPEDAIVCGRIGRPANFDPVAITAFSKAVQKYSNLYYLIVAPCQEIKRFITIMNVPNVILIEPTIHDQLINKFYRTIDIFLHYRYDGECHSTAIAQAMMYGIPVISHKSPHYNGQIETIGDGGYVSRKDDEYYEFLCQLIENKDLRKKFADNGRKIALENYEQKKIVKQIEQCYLEWFHEKRG
jgi:glycosyltransferase involved in cell wall biosynthesis